MSLAVDLPCADGVRLSGHLWPAPGRVDGVVIVNGTTGVPATHYHDYARYLARSGFETLTYDYRGVGGSRPHDLQSCGYRWDDWGTLDFEAALAFMTKRHPMIRPLVVGHGTGGFIPGFAPSARRIHRMLAVGPHYSYWRDYPADRRREMVLRWHVVMPLLTCLLGYFPGKSLGWLEDLPRRIAYDWAFRRRDMEASHSKSHRVPIINRFEQVAAPILAVVVAGDEFGTRPAAERSLRRYSAATKLIVHLTPTDFRCHEIGHLGLFEARHEHSFWARSLLWLRDACNPWPLDVVWREKAGGTAVSAYSPCRSSRVGGFTLEYRPVDRPSCDNPRRSPPS